MPKTTGLFHLFYTSLFTFLSFILFVLILLTPGDIIYQSYTNKRLGNIFATTGVYVVTLLIAILLYASRIFTNRSVLAGIPRPWIPVEKPDVEKRVRKLVVAGLSRSAIIAQQAKPRDQTGEDTSLLDPALTIPKDAPAPWGKVSHPGWTGPDIPDLPNQEFEPVVSELPTLIEAKAVSLAPLDPRLMAPTASSSKHVQISPDTIPPDERVFEALQRPRNMCLRDYLNHLGRLDLIDPPHLSEEFIRLYERSRFSAHPLTEAEFREMMGLFAEILRGMKYLDPVIIAELQDEGDDGDGYSGYGYGFDSGASYISGQSSITSSDRTVSNSDASFTSGISRERGRRGRYHPSSSGSSSSGRSGGFRLGMVGSNGSDGYSFRSYLRRDQTPSTRSLRPVRSNLSELSEQSVIRRTTTRA